MITLRQMTASAALSLSLVLASSAAFADQHGPQMAFPATGAAFKQHVAEKLEKRRARMEAKLAAEGASAEQAAQARARFAEHTTKLNAAVEKAVADGTVTKEEAQEVRAASGHGGACKGKGETKA